MFVGDRKLVDPVFAADPEGRIQSRQIRDGNMPAAGKGLKSPSSHASVMDHVEAQVAAIMRRPGAPKEVLLVINNEPCDRPGRPLTCEKILRGILPADARLKVYLSDGHRTHLYGVYIGTGEKIK